MIENVGEETAGTSEWVEDKKESPLFWEFPHFDEDIVIRSWYKHKPEFLDFDK